MTKDFTNIFTKIIDSKNPSVTLLIFITLLITIFLFKHFSSTHNKKRAKKEYLSSYNQNHIEITVNNYIPEKKKDDISNFK
ncbi:hypothetical protein ACYRFS_13000 [Listeria kieliensis]